MKNIPLLVDLLDSDETIEGEGYLTVYFTKSHQEKNIPGWIFKADFEAYKKLQKDYKKQEHIFMWRRK